MRAGERMRSTPEGIWGGGINRRTHYQLTPPLLHHHGNRRWLPRNSGNLQSGWLWDRSARTGPCQSRATSILASTPNWVGWTECRYNHLYQCSQKLAGLHQRSQWQFSDMKKNLIFLAEWPFFQQTYPLIRRQGKEIICWHYYIKKNRYKYKYAHSAEGLKLLVGDEGAIQAEEEDGGVGEHPAEDDQVVHVRAGHLYHPADRQTDRQTENKEVKDAT